MKATDRRCWYWLVLGVIAGLQVAVRAQNCTYKCAACPPNPFYDIVDGNCTTRKDYAIGGEAGDVLRQKISKAPDGALGSALCYFDDVAIRDNASCMSMYNSTARSVYGVPNLFDVVTFFGGGTISVVWNDTTGCHAISQEPYFYGSDIIEVRLCFRVIRWYLILGLVIGGIVAGMLLAFIGVCICRRNTIKDTFDKNVAHREDFWPGAKTMVAHSRISCKRRLVGRIYRCSQVIANLWLPAVLLMFYNWIIVIPLLLVLYLLPAIFDVGSTVFVQPIFLITPDVSLFGIDHIKPKRALCRKVFCLIRPIIMVFATVFIARAAGIVQNTSGLNETARELFGTWTFNQVGYFRAGMMSGAGPFVLDFVLIGTPFGLAIYMLMTTCLILQAAFHGGSMHGTPCISIVWDEFLLRAIEDVAGQACDIASKYDAERGSRGSDHEIEIAEEPNEYSSLTDEETDRTEIMKLKDMFFGADRSPAYQQIQELHKKSPRNNKGNPVQPLTPLRKRDVLFAVVLLICDILAYIYKIVFFMGGSQYILAALIVTSLSEAFCGLVFEGTLSRACTGWKRAIHDGVATVDYLACTCWDDGIAGVPYLLATIYGLPLAGIKTPLWSFVAVFFIITGTNAMGKFIQDSVDCGMFEFLEDPYDNPSDEVSSPTSRRALTAIAAS